MLRLSLGRLLIGINVCLIFLAIVCVALGAAARLEHLADEQALATVQLAGSSALKEISQFGEALEASVRNLGERPTLAPLLAKQDRSALVRFLIQFQRASRFSGCAIMSHSAVLASSGDSHAWEQIASDRGALDGHSFIQLVPDGDLLLAAASPIPTVPGTNVLCLLELNRGFEQELSERIGLPVRILDREAALARGAEPQADMRAGALMDGLSQTERLDEAGLYVNVLPLWNPSGRSVGIVETGLSRSAIASPLLEMQKSFAALAVTVAMIAGVLSLILAKWLTRPLEALTKASARIGGGDLATPIARASGRETGALAETMEEMRRRLLHLTAELRRRRAEAEAILGGIAEGVFAVDRERKIRYLNPQAAAFLGLEPGEAVGKFCGDVLNPQGPGGVRPCDENCPIVRARSSGNARASEKLLLPGGRSRIVVITSAAAGWDDSAMSAEGPEVVRQFQVMRDETEVEATRRLRDAVLANISHEFKTPLAAQLASIEMLRDRLPDLNGPEAQELVLSLERGTLRLTQLIDNLLESVRIEAGRLSIRRRTVALDEVVEEAMEMTAPLISQRGQSLSVELPYPLPPIQGDPPRLSQVFVNLLANANKFAPMGSSIRIGGTVGERDVTLWVEDEGPGPPPGGGASLFERFVRAAGSEDEEEPEQTGMGLGLWIVKSIVERHGGRVETRPASGNESSSEQARTGSSSKPGTRVCVTFPWQEGNEDPGR